MSLARHAILRWIFLAAFVVARVPVARAALHVSPGIGLVSITGAATGTELVLEDRHHHEVARGTTDTFGSLMFRELSQGAQYVVRVSSTESTPVTILRFQDNPAPSFYAGQTLHDGFQYIKARDGTLLAAMVRPPAGATLNDGPFPTVVEYSGYPAADPDNLQPASLIATVVGYATVGVNMRGSGCSGGVIDLFDLPTTADGYDIIETVAAQSWVKGGKVGMIGISFPGISQVFVGGAQPPHLAAVAPLSVIADIYRAPGFPGGIFNNGFAQTWLQERKDDAAPAPDGGQSYARTRVQNGDTVCRDNQKLRLQTIDPVAFTRSNPYYVPELMDQRSPINWIGDIEVPTFLAGAWQDEQTGGDFVSMLSRLARRPDAKITLTNGVHTSSLDPDTLWNWLAFLDLYVDGRVPNPGRLAPIARIIYQMILGPGSPRPPLPADRFVGITDYEQARALFEADPHVRILMENGAGSPRPGVPAPTFELGFDRWPPAEANPSVWYFGPNGTLTRRRPRSERGDVDTYRPDPASRPTQTLPGQGQDQSWVILPAYDWEPLVPGTALAYATPPLDADTTVVGPGSVDLWLRSSADDTDLQVTLSEIRPDGLETYVQSGWLRASHRQLDRKRSSVLEPVPTHLERDARPMPADDFAKVRVGLYAVAHVFRRGSRIRLGIEAPGDDRTRWAFDTFPTGGAVTNEIARTRMRASRLVLSVVPGGDTPPTLPPCPGLRGEPCRTYERATNGG